MMQEERIAEIVQSLMNSPEISGVVDDRIYHWGPPSTARLPVLTNTIADIRPVQHADNQAIAQEWVIILDAFCRGSPKLLADAAETAMQSIGFQCEYRSDVPAEDGVNQITMRFSNILEV